MDCGYGLKVTVMNSIAGYQPFPNTHWSLVRRAGVADGDARREALAVLLARYQPALKSYLRLVRRLRADDADDLLQSFVAEQLMERELLLTADPSRGRFRSLLLVSLNNFATSRYRLQNRRKTEPLDFSAPDRGHSPPAVMEAAWARTLIHTVVQSLQQFTQVVDLACGYLGGIRGPNFGRYFQTGLIGYAELVLPLRP